MSLDEFTEEERLILQRYFSNADSPVFVLTNLPDVVKGALFSRYSRSAKSLRRLFLDEFYDGDADAPDLDVGLSRAKDLYARVFGEYGDDSVAQLVNVHLAVEGASNILTKLLERGRLMSYLEQSTRYVPYDDKPGGRWRYHVPAEIRGTDLEERFTTTLDGAFQLYADLMRPLQDYLADANPRPDRVSQRAYANSIRAKACDILRGLLPAATVSNVGIYGSAQALEGLVLRLKSHSLAEARDAGDAVLRELQTTVPVFMERVARPDRGPVWAGYLADIDRRNRQSMLPRKKVLRRSTVELTDFDPEGEEKVVAAALFEFTLQSDRESLEAAHDMSQKLRRAYIREYVGKRMNRRHKPGRAFERTSYRFDIVSDYGAFRDLQRHRLLTIEWQQLTPHLGYEVPREIKYLGKQDDWRSVMRDCSRLYSVIEKRNMPLVAQYVIPMAYRIRFVMEMNAREAMHVIELRTSAQAHRNYRDICLKMHRLIRDQAGHKAIAAAMKFVGEGGDGLERLASEQRNAERRLVR